MPDSSLVFLDIDTQADFMLPTGRLYVPQAETIIPNLVRLMSWAREHNIPVISPADTHAPDDPEFQLWPPHCVAGTPGQRRIPETLFPNPVVVENRPGAFRLTTGWVGQIILEKPVYDFTSNPNTEAILASFHRPAFVAFGVATEYCACGRMSWRCAVAPSPWTSWWTPSSPSRRRGDGWRWRKWSLPGRAWSPPWRCAPHGLAVEG